MEAPFIRPAKEGDLETLGEICAQSVLRTCRNHYTSAQCTRWSAALRLRESWEKRLAEQVVLVGIVNQQIVGVASFVDGYIDTLYTHPEYQGMGVAGTLYHQLEKLALQRGHASLTSDVSKTAFSFFLKLGFSVVAQQERKLDDITFINYRMIKRLPENS